MSQWPQETAPVKSDFKGGDGPSWALTRYCLALWNTFSVNVGLAEQIPGALRNCYPDQSENGCRMKRFITLCSDAQG